MPCVKMLEDLALSSPIQYHLACSPIPKQQKPRWDLSGKHCFRAGRIRLSSAWSGDRSGGPAACPVDVAGGICCRGVLRLLFSVAVRRCFFGGPFARPEDRTIAWALITLSNIPAAALG